MRILQFSQGNNKLPLLQKDQGNYPVVTIYGTRKTRHGFVILWYDP